MSSMVEAHIDMDDVHLTHIPHYPTALQQHSANATPMSCKAMHQARHSRCDALSNNMYQLVLLHMCHTHRFHKYTTHNGSATLEYPKCYALKESRVMHQL